MRRAIALSARSSSSEITRSSVELTPGGGRFTMLASRSSSFCDWVGGAASPGSGNAAPAVGLAPTLCHASPERS